MAVTEVSCEFGGRLLTFQTGKLAKQADAAVLCRYGDTVVLATVVSNRSLGEKQDFFPLTVDYQEKYYAAGRIPGGFFKREARPSERATLSARLIDRPIRPLFPEDYRFETNVVTTILSTDGQNEPDIVASLATSAALHISDIPWGGPIGTCRVGMLEGKFVVNVPPSDQPQSDLLLLVSGVESGVIMVEGSAKEVSEASLRQAVFFAHSEMQVVMNAIQELRAKAGKEKRTYDTPLADENLKSLMRSYLSTLFENAFSIPEKLARYEALGGIKKMVLEKHGRPAVGDDTAKKHNHLVELYFEELKAEFARLRTVKTGRRIDGRDYTTIRPISTEVGLLPRAHGSALFTRGETQVLASVTLGTGEDEQKIDDISGVHQKTFMLHYNFPPYSVGEARPLRAPGRREIGHGHLAEKALSYVVPMGEAFPYTIRIVAEVLESNGSSSMASVCSGSLALMDAGVPIPKPVAGVAMGLIKEGDAVAVLSDIIGDEDHLGDMDFKVCGTESGVTAFQMDLKIGGINEAILEQALAQARDGRLHILSKMGESLTRAREKFSSYAPRIHTLRVKPDKVREVIGSGGKVIRGIIEQTGVKIDIEDDGLVRVAAVDELSAQKAIDIIQRIVEEPEEGKVYEGRVTKIAEFGAFVEIIPGTEGLVHVSELAHEHVRNVEDILKVGEIVQVKCLRLEPQGKIRLSRKALLEVPPGGSSRSQSGRGSMSQDEGGQRSSQRGGGHRHGGGGRSGGGEHRGGYRSQGRRDGGSGGGSHSRDRRHDGGNRSHHGSQADGSSQQPQQGRGGNATSDAGGRRNQEHDRSHNRDYQSDPQPQGHGGESILYSDDSDDRGNS